MTNEEIGIRILHVDDDASMLHIAKVMLNVLGGSFVVDGSLGAEEAFRKLAENKYDLIVSDYDMPIKSGLDFLKELKEQKIDIPFILFTGKGREEIAIQALNMGANGYINKQGDPETVYGELTHLIKTVYSHKQAKDALVESENKYRRMSSLIADVAFSCIEADEGFKIDWIIGATEKLFGCSIEEIQKGGCWGSFVDPRDVAIFKRNVTELLPGQQEVCELRINHKDGSIKSVKVTARCEIENGIIPRLFGAIEDITERKKAQQQVVESEDRGNKIFFANAAAMTIARLPEGVWIDVNDRFCALTGYSRDELLGHTSLELGMFRGKPEDRQRVINELQTKGRIDGIEVQALKKDGEELTVIQSSAIVDLNGQKYAVVSHIDVTGRKKAEKDLEQALSRLHLAHEASKSGIWEWNLQTNKNSWSDETWRLYGLKPGNAEASFGLWVTTVHPDDRTRVIDAINEAVKNQTELLIEYRLSDSHCKGCWLMSRGKPQKNAQGITETYLGVVIDITERKNAEASLIESRELFAKAFYNNPLPMSIGIIPDGKLVDVNDGFSKLTGFDRNDAIGHTAIELGLIKVDETQKERVKTVKTKGALLQREVIIYPKKWKAIIRYNVFHSSKNKRKGSCTYPISSIG